MKFSAKNPDPLDHHDFGFLDLQICGSTDPDPRGKISTIYCKRNLLLSEPKSELLKKISYQNIPSFDLDPDLDPDPFFSSVDPDLHPNVMDPNLYNLAKRFFCNFGSDQIN